MRHVEQTLWDNWLEPQPWFWSISAPGIVSKPVGLVKDVTLGTMSGTFQGLIGVLASNEELAGIVYLVSLGFKAYVVLPFQCVSSLSNYALTEDYMNGKFRKIPEHASLGDRIKAVWNNPIPVLGGGAAIFVSLATWGLAPFPVLGFLLSKGMDFTSGAVVRGTERAARSDLTRALNQVGRARIPHNISEELTSTMLAVVQSGDRRAVMPKLLAAITIAKEFDGVNDNLAIDIATNVARCSGGNLPNNINHAVLNALAQAATQNRGHIDETITEFGRRLRANGVNFLGQDERDTGEFVNLVKQRVGRSR